ncbi:MAG: FAD binding domain-containing protein [Paracoccaceae bacterium]
MIPAAFDYHRPASVAEAVRLIGQLGEDARVLAGGHSLIPMMKLRMASVEHLIDLRGLAELKGIAVEGEAVRIGAMTTQAELIEHEGLARACPLIREAALQIADPQVRAMGTVGGNVANGDPGNDMPGLMQCLDAAFAVTGPEGTREVAARDFYLGAYETARDDGEILTEIRLSATPRGTGHAYEKQKRKIGDYATAAAAVLTGPSGAAIAMTNLGPTPVYSAEASDALASGDVEGAVAAMLAAIDPAPDNRGPVEFKRHVAGVMLRRAIARAQARAA